jgi:hypothetical protein
VRKDGSRFWASGVLYSLRDASGACIGYGKILRNRTDHREIVETLRNRVTSLEEAARRQDAFVSTLSHELANPLGPLSNAARIIRSAGEPSENVEFALRVIERQVHLLRTLVSDLLEFSRAGAGKIELKLARLSVNEVVADAVQDTRSLMEERRHALQVVETRGRIEAIADAERLHQVFVNLLTNAAKYTRPGGRSQREGRLRGPGSRGARRRQRRRHPPRDAAADLRPVHPGRRHAAHGDGRAGHRARPREGAGRAARRHGAGDQRRAAAWAANSPCACRCRPGRALPDPSASPRR